MKRMEIKVERRYSKMNKLSEKMLRKWRKEALQTKATIIDISVAYNTEFFISQDRILRLTQELLDNHLLSK